MNVAENRGIGIGIQKGIERGYVKGIEKGIEKGMEKERRQLIHALFNSGAKLSYIAMVMNMPVE